MYLQKAIQSDYEKRPKNIPPGALAICFLVFYFLIAAVYGRAAEDEDCYICHSDATLTMETADGTVKSVYVKEGILEGTVHADNGCVSCHDDADVEEFPHESPLAKVDCGNCHDDIAAQNINSVHGIARAGGNPDAPQCSDCHGKHTIYSHTHPKSPTFVMNIPATCGQCHQEGEPAAKRTGLSKRDITKSYSMSIHGRGLFEAGLTVTAVCTNCHTSHNILPYTDDNSSINVNNIASTCLQCHAQIEKVHQKVIRGELWEKQPDTIPACVDCHSPHQIRRVFYTEQFTDQFCLNCHGSRSIVRTNADGSVDSLFVNVDELLDSAHGQNISCVKCHTHVSPKKHPVCKDSGPVDCTNCHAKVGDTFAQGIHGKLVQEGDPNAPTCVDCHGQHNILPRDDVNSATFTRNIPKLCAKCHREGQQAAVRYQGVEHEVISHYTMSIHGKGIFESGLTVAAVCSDCHNSHLALPASDPNSSVYPDNVGNTCGKCHVGIYEIFKTSIHSPLVSGTDKNLPGCNDCHSSHEIERTDRADFKTQLLNQCGGCHHELTESYFNTYHGKVSKLGSTIAAKCSDCHGSHNILPPSNPASTLSQENIVETCKTCHANSNRKFAGYLTHATHQDKHKYPYLYYTFWAMTWLVIGVFVFFGIHTLLWIPRSIRERAKVKKEIKGKPIRYVKRFESLPRILHILVIISFFLLALTGMALKFAGTGWAQALMILFGGARTAGILHRLGALITFFYFFMHFVYIYRHAQKANMNFFKFMFHKEGMVPRAKDFKEFFQTILWFFGKSEAPKYGRWTYWEKFDYFAVFWGVAIIGSTGLVLWLPEFFTRIIPGYFINIATIIHSDEALLATGFIFTIHFFNTHFRPQKFPMDQVIFHGRVPYEEWKHERPREVEILEQNGKLDESIFVDAPKKWVVISSRILGFLALIIGVLLVLLIAWAMLTQY